MVASTIEAPPYVDAAGDAPFSAGERIVLTNEATGLSAALLVEPGSGGGLMLALAERPYHRLHRAEQKPGAVFWRPTAGHRAAIWRLEREAGGDAAVRVVPYGRTERVAECCLGLDGAEPNFGVNGYCLLRGLVSAAKLSRALRLLNHHLGSASLADDVEPRGLGTEFVGGAEGSAAEGAAGAGVVKLGGGHRCTCSLAQAPPLLDLLSADERREVRRVLEAHGGCGADAGGVSGLFGCQVALRFPLALPQGAVVGDEALPPLLDRLEWHTDAAKYNEKKRFDLVVGIFLSSVPSPSDGALYVLPGSHRGPGETRSAAGGVRSPPRAVLAQPGDAIVFDRELVHAGGPNLGSAIRYALYFRLRLE